MQRAIGRNHAQVQRTQDGIPCRKAALQFPLQPLYYISVFCKYSHSGGTKSKTVSLSMEAADTVMQDPAVGPVSQLKATSECPLQSPSIHGSPQSHAQRRINSDLAGRHNHQLHSRHARLPTGRGKRFCSRCQPILGAVSGNAILDRICWGCMRGRARLWLDAGHCSNEVLHLWHGSGATNHDHLCNAPRLRSKSTSFL